MPYGTIKVDNITFTDNSVDKTVSLSGLIQNPTFTGNVTVTGTISGDVIRGGTTISGVTVTGTTANFVSGVFTTQVSGTTIIATTGTFTSLTGTTTTGTTANFVSGVFTTRVSGATITGTTVSTTTGSFVSLTGTTATFTSGIIASGTAALPSLSILSDPNTGIYSSGADELAISTNGTEKLIVKSDGKVGLGTSNPGGKLDVRDAGTTIPALGAVGTGLNVRRTDGTIGLIIGYENTIGGSYIQAQHTNGSAAAYPLYLQPNGGNVGIGTTSFGGKLTVKTSTSNGAPLTWNDGQLVVTAGDGTTAPGFGISTNTGDNSVSLSALTPGTGWNTIHYRAASHVFYRSDASSNEVGRFDTSGRLLVGTTNSRASYAGKLEIEGTTSAATIAVTRNSVDAAPPYLFLAKSRSASVGGNAIVSNNDILGYFGFVGSDGTQPTIAASITGEVDGTPGTNDMPGRLVFSTTADGASSPTERLRIDNGGTTKSTCASTNFICVNTGGSGTALLYFQTASAELGKITHNGSNSVTYATSSDYRLKENVVLLPNGIARVKQLKPSSFNFLNTPDVTVDGFLAHEAQEIVPECATGFKDEVDENGKPVMQGIDQSKLVPLLTAALQEAIAKIEALETRLSALEGA